MSCDALILQKVFPFPREAFVIRNTMEEMQISFLCFLHCKVIQYGTTMNLEAVLMSSLILNKTPFSHLNLRKKAKTVVLLRTCRSSILGLVPYKLGTISSEAFYPSDMIIVV